MAPSTAHGRALGWLRPGPGGADVRVAFALLYTALVLLVHEYFFSFAALTRHEWLRGIGGGQGLGVGLAWVAARLVFWVVIPAIVVRAWHREPLASIGWDAHGLVRHLRVYLLLYALVLPIVLLASRRPDFTATYPFLGSARADLSMFLLWECAYAASFLALEAFFRGYLLFTCSARLGWLAIFVMIVPYTMIHFHKPWPEALGAVAAGVTLGAVALAYRSFLGGAVVHALVAVTMDTLAVRHAGLFQ